MTPRTDRQTWEALSRIQGCAARLDILVKELCGWTNVDDCPRWRETLSSERRRLDIAFNALTSDTAHRRPGGCADGILHRCSRCGEQYVQGNPVGAFIFGILAGALGVVFCMYAAPILRWLFVLGAAR